MSRDWPARIAAWAEPLSATDFLLRLTLVYLLTDELGSYWYVRVGVALLAALGLLFDRHARPALWAALSTLLAVKVAFHWERVDNHSYLTAYWCLAVALSLLARDRAAALAANARLLVGLSFLFATLWKVWLVDDFVSGGFFHFSFLWDRRFAATAMHLGGLDAGQLQANHALLAAQAASARMAEVTLQLGAPLLAQTARGLAWLTVGLEALVALAFLWPGRAGPGRLRDAALLFFLWTTYAVAPVAGYGVLLAILGAAQCPNQSARLRLGYLATAAAVYALHHVPWRLWLV